MFAGDLTATVGKIICPAGIDINGYLIGPSVSPYLSTVNQSLTTSSPVTFASVNSSYFGNVTGHVSLEGKTNIYFYNASTIRGIINQYGNWNIGVAELALESTALYISKALSISGSGSLINFNNTINHMINIGKFTIPSKSIGILTQGNLSVDSGQTCGYAAAIELNPFVKSGPGILTNNYGLYIPTNPLGGTNENIAIKCKGVTSISTLIGDNYCQAENDTLYLGIATSMNFFLDRNGVGGSIIFGFNTIRGLAQSNPFQIYDNNFNRELLMTTTSRGDYEPGPGSSSVYFPKNVNIGTTDDIAGYHNHRLAVTNNSTSGTVATFLSGHNNNHVNIGIGRLSDEARIAVVAINENYASDALTGDLIIRSDDPSKYVRLLSGTGNSIFSCSGDGGAYLKIGNFQNTSSLQVDIATGRLTYPGSSQRFKKNIEDCKIDTSLIYKIKVHEFDYKEENGNCHDIGLIAEDVHEIPDLRYLVVYNAKKEPSAINYDKITLYLLEEQKKLLERIEKLENIIKTNNIIE